MSKKDEKTNVMRVLEASGIAYEGFSYDALLANAAEVAAALGQDSGAVFKTLVTVGKSKEHYVFMLPSDAELDLKKAAAVVGEKSVEMIAQKELLPLTGYIHGGCSPIGMRKKFDSYIDKSALMYEYICCSGGRVGFQIKLKTTDIIRLVPLTATDIVKQT